MPVEVFVSYSRKDAAFLQQLLPHLELLGRRGIVSVRYDDDLKPGQRFDPELRKSVESAQVFLALVSIDYLTSEYCFEKELAWALAKERSGDYFLLPVLLRPCDWRNTELARFSVLPRDAAYVSQSADVDAELHDICVELERLARYVSKAAGEPVGARRYFPRTSRVQNVPELPNQFVERVEASARLREIAAALVAKNRAHSDRQPSTLALCGLGGSGKTSLAVAHARDPAVLGDFQDGVLWVTCGRNADVVELQTALLGLVGHHGEVSDRWQENKKTIVDVFEDLDALIVLDDVWFADQALALCGDFHRSLVLMTSRFSKAVAQVNATVVTLQHPPERVALDMLARYADRPAGQIPPSGAEIVRRCGYLPLAVAVMGSLIRNGTFSWDSLLRALVSSVERPALMQYTTVLRDYEWRSIEAAFQASVDSLDDRTAAAFLACRVFDRSTTFPRQVFRDLTLHLHGGDFAAYLAIEDALVSRSLLSRRAEGDDVLLTIHDLLIDYAAAKAGASEENPHATLIRNIRARLGEIDLVTRLRDELFEPYYRDELLHHLAQSPEAALAANIILDLRWMTRRIRRFGPSKLLADCGDSDGIEAVREVRDALQMSAHILGRAPEELFVQLEGRLTDEVFEAISSQRPATPARAIQLRAIRKNFERGGGVLERTLVFDGSPILEVAVDRDRKLVAALSLDGALAVASLETGDVRFSRAVGPVAGRPRFCVAGARLLLDVPGGALREINLDAFSVTPVTTGSGAAVGPFGGLTAEATGRGLLLAWDEHGLHRLLIADGEVQLDTITEVGRIEDCSLDVDSGLFVVAEEGGLLNWGQIDAQALMFAAFDCGGEVRFARLMDGGLNALLFYYSGDIARLDLRRRAVVWRRHLHTDWIECVSLDETAGVLATGGHDRRMVVSRISDGSIVLDREETAGYIKSVRLWRSETQDGESVGNVAWSSLDESLKTGELRSGGRSATILGHSGRINAIEPGSGPGMLVSCSDDGSVRVWNAERSYAVPVGTADHRQRISSIHIDGDRAWTASYDGSVRVWDATSGTPIAERGLESRPIHVVEGIGEGVCLAGAETGGVHRLSLDEEAGTLPAEQVDDLGSWVPAILRLPGTSRAVIGSGDGYVRVYDEAEQRIERSAPVHRGAVRCFAPAAGSSWRLMQNSGTGPATTSLTCGDASCRSCSQGVLHKPHGSTRGRRIGGSRSRRSKHLTA